MKDMKGKFIQQIKIMSIVAFIVAAICMTIDERKVGAWFSATSMGKIFQVHSYVQDGSFTSDLQVIEENTQTAMDSIKEVYRVVNGRDLPIHFISEDYQK